jgi:hypothetical protein
MSKQRVYALLLILGSAILLFRTLAMVAGGYLTYQVWWAAALIIAEMIIDAGCMLSAAWWFRINERSRDKLPLRLGTAAALMHAIRVLVYVLGRTGPWINFDYKPEYHYMFEETEWFWVWFAAILAILGVAGVVIIWRIRIRNRKHQV